jgi:translocation protein SEC62
VFSEEDGFYAWTFERKMSAWHWALSAIVPIATLSACLFPVFPRVVKVGVLYFCLCFLCLIFGLLLRKCLLLHLQSLLVSKLRD